MRDVQRSWRLRLKRRTLELVNEMSSQNFETISVRCDVFWKDQREESDGSKDSERLIAKAREVVEQISRWRDVPMTPAEEN
jgi:hypothetical protein